MTKKTVRPCDLVAGPLSDDISEILSKTLSDGRERGFFVLREGARITRTETEVGTSKQIMLDIGLLQRLFGLPGTPIATVHTHPDIHFDYLFSLTDIHSLIANEFKFSVVAYGMGGEQFAKVFVTDGAKDFGEFKNEVLELTFPSGRPEKIRENDFLRLVKNANKLLEVCNVRI